MREPLPQGVTRDENVNFFLNVHANAHNVYA